MASSDPFVDEVTAIRQVLQTSVNTHVFPGAVAVIRRGTETRTVVVGRADVARRVPMAETDRFQIGSVTKSMVAAVALQLVDQGRVRLSDTVERWEPGLLPRGQAITVEDLLGQTSGLPDFTLSPRFSHVVTRPSSTPGALVGLVAHSPLEFRPGARSSYSSTNYLVLGMVLAKASHEPLATLLERRLFDPLGMTGSSLGAAAAATPPLAHGYDHHTDVTDTGLSWAWAARGVTATAGDVARFYDSLFAGHVVSGPLLRRMLAQRPETNHQLPFSGYGLGVATLPTRCGEAYGHSGALPGFVTQAWTTQDRSRSIVLALSTSLSRALDEPVSTVIDEALCAS